MSLLYLSQTKKPTSVAENRSGDSQANTAVWFTFFIFSFYFDITTSWVYHTTIHCHMWHEYCTNTSHDLRKSVCRTIPRAVMRQLFRYNECVRDQTSCKGNVGKKWSSLDLNIFPSAPENCFCFGPSTWYLFADHKESQRSTECPLCLCTVSAAVVAKIVLKSLTHMCQLSSCHLKVRKARVWKEICSSLTLFKLQEWQNSVEWHRVPSG